MPTPPWKTKLIIEGQLLESNLHVISLVHSGRITGGEVERIKVQRISSTGYIKIDCLRVGSRVDPIQTA